MSYLEAIIEFHKRRAAADNRPIDQAIEHASKIAKPPSFRGAIKKSMDQDRLALIAEIKRGSPSKGQFDTTSLLPIERWAKLYQDSGASCISVLTDTEHFYAETTDLPEAAALEIPILRKDFTVCELDVVDAKILGASAILLIASVLDSHQLRDLYQLANQLELDALIELHSVEEVEKLNLFNPEIVGINQRNLKTFEVDSQYAAHVASSLDGSCIKIAESGISSSEDAIRIKESGFDGILVGESIVCAANPAEQVSLLSNI